MIKSLILIISSQFTHLEKTIPISQAFKILSFQICNSNATGDSDNNQCIDTSSNMEEIKKLKYENEKLQMENQEIKRKVSY